jgi:carbohydrate diacid regulator
MDMVTREIAEEIVHETMTRLNRNINIMDAKGMIIASGDPSRINKLHEGAIEVIETGKPLIITEKDKDKYPGALSGINLPIEFQGKVVGVIGITGEQNKVQEFGGLVKMTTEMMIKQSFLASQSEWEQRTVEMILEELLQSVPSWEFIEQRTNLLKIDLAAPFFAVILEMKERAVMNQKILSQAKEFFGHNHCLTGFLSVSRMFILTLGLSEELVNDKLTRLNSMFSRLGIEIKIGVGTGTSRPDRIAMAYREAELALRLEAGEITYYSKVEAKALIYQLDEDLKRRFLSRLFPKPTNKTIETLKKFFECNLNITEASKKLYVHRNTLLYRLRRVKEDTGYDPHLFVDALPLQLAVWMYDSMENGPSSR